MSVIFGGSHMMGFKKFLEGVDCNLENKGDKLIITITGDKEKLEVVEKKLKAMKELCCCHHDGCC